MTGESEKKPDLRALPYGYRVVAIASDTWVLLAPGGLRVVRYHGELDLWRADVDARKHRRGE
jgi:hypothetical protein